MTAVTLELDDRDVLRALTQMLYNVDHLEPALDAIGNAMKESILLNFTEQHAPDGEPWETLSDVTLANRRKHGKGAEILRDTGRLNQSITHNTQAFAVEIGTDVKYANMMQFGGKRADFPWLWGDIPARPFVGFSEHDIDEITAILRDYLNRSVR